MAGSVIGLDISSRGLLAVEIEDPSGRKPKLVRAAEIALDEGQARDTEVIDIAAVSSALTRLWKVGKFKSKRVVLGAGNQRVLVREHTAPRMPLTQLRQALPYQVQDLLPVPVAETILDFYPIEPSPQAPDTEIRGLLVAALKDAVETNVAALSDAGLSVIQVDLAPFAGIRAITQAAAPEGTHTVVSIAPRTTTISVIKDGVPQFVRIVPAGGETITDAVAEILNADRATSEKVKRHLGLEQGADPRHKPVSQAMLDALKGIFGSIRSTAECRWPSGARPRGSPSAPVFRRPSFNDANSTSPSRSVWHWGTHNVRTQSISFTVAGPRGRDPSGQPATALAARRPQAREDPAETAAHDRGERRGRRAHRWGRLCHGDVRATAP